MDSKHIPNEALKSHFLALYCMVVADGIIDVAELETLYRIGFQQYGISAEEINHAILNTGSAFVVPESFEAKIQFLYNLASIAWADGQLEDTEINLMRKYVVRVGFLNENADAITTYILDSVKNGLTIEDVINQINS